MTLKAKILFTEDIHTQGHINNSTINDINLNSYLYEICFTETENIFLKLEITFCISLEYSVKFIEILNLKKAVLLWNIFTVIHMWTKIYLSRCYDTVASATWEIFSEFLKCCNLFHKAFGDWNIVKPLYSGHNQNLKKLSAKLRFFPNWLILLQKTVLVCYDIVLYGRCWEKKDPKGIKL